jgi:hypothetical protein
MFLPVDVLRVSSSGSLVADVLELDVLGVHGKKNLHFKVRSSREHIQETCE